MRLLHSLVFLIGTGHCGLACVSSALEWRGWVLRGTPALSLQNTYSPVKGALCPRRSPHTHFPQLSLLNELETEAGKEPVGAACQEARSGSVLPLGPGSGEHPLPPSPPRGGSCKGSHIGLHRAALTPAQGGSSLKTGIRPTLRSRSFSESGHCLALAASGGRGLLSG